MVSPALILKKTRVGMHKYSPSVVAFIELTICLAPAVCRPWEGKLASTAGLSGFAITTPTQHYVPRYPRDVDIVHTYSDGRWGVHEYSRHPQIYHAEMTHVACIPRSPSPPDIPDILYTTLRAAEHWIEDAGMAVRGLGLIRDEVRQQLRAAADSALAWADSMYTANEDAHQIGRAHV